MATRIAWLLNFDADIELQDPVRFARTSRGRAPDTILLARLTDLLGDDDLVLGDMALGQGVSDLTVLAFCPTPSALCRIAKLGLVPPVSPPLSLLRHVNDRAFCAELGHGLPYSLFARDMLSLESHVATPSPSGTYVIKRAFSFAGREQRRVQGALDPSTRGFCTRSFARGEGVQVEPWVERIADFSRHGYLTQEGKLLTGATRAQRCDAMGRFEGVSAAPLSLSDEQDAQLREVLRQTGEALQKEGYFGPFGIDGFLYRKADGRAELNARCEVNARFTMGYPRALLLAGLAADRTHALLGDGDA